MKKKIFWLAAGVFLAALVAFTAWQTQALELNTCVVTSQQLPDAFAGYRIAHVSDLHNGASETASFLSAFSIHRKWSW